MARKKGAVAVKPAAEKQTKEVNKTIESLYSQLVTLLKKNKISKNEVAKRLGMSYQGFLNSFNKRNLRLEAWFEISEMVNKPFVARFDSAKNIAEMEEGASAVSAPLSRASAASDAADDFKILRLRNAEEKIAILEKQIGSLESQIQDKQTIIELIRK
ncbi:MAG TPA: hypothetical protein DIW47_11335 [Bacteroidetes bacterium]|nr:hypothetical protein [Bacteroidota bacterium]